MAQRVLAPRALNRALLARQLLLRRSSASVPQALERIGGLQTQYAPSGYVGLWSRLRDFRRPMLTRALERRRVVQATLMRATIHLVSAADFPLFIAGIREERRRWWQRATKAELGDVDIVAVARLVRDHLADGPLRQAELVAMIVAAGYPKAVWSGVGLWVDLVRVPPSGTWERRRADLYGRADLWLAAAPAAAGPVTEDEGVVHLVRRYLSGFGPAPVADIANWAGLPIGRMRAVMERLSLRRFRDEEGRELVDLPRAPLPDADVEAPVRFLPTWDATLLVHARRTGILPEEYRPLLFSSKTPHSFPTFLVDGVVAGTWRYEDSRIRLDPFAPLPRAVRSAVDAEAKELAAWH